jgi:hypothetical protein
VTFNMHSAKNFQVTENTFHSQGPTGVFADGLYQGSVYASATRRTKPSFTWLSVYCSNDIAFQQSRRK